MPTFKIRSLKKLKTARHCRNILAFHLHGSSILPTSTRKNISAFWALLFFSGSEQSACALCVGELKAADMFREYTKRARRGRDLAKWRRGKSCDSIPPTSTIIKKQSRESGAVFICANLGHSREIFQHKIIRDQLPCILLRDTFKNESCPYYSVALEYGSVIITMRVAVVMFPAWSVAV